MPIVTRDGFSMAEPINTVRLDELHQPDAADAKAVEVASEADVERLMARNSPVALVQIPFASSHDGVGYSLARRLRNLGFTGRIRARGDIISDQFRYALACGIDEVEISEALAARQPEEHWTGDIAPARSYRDKIQKPVIEAPASVFAETVTRVTHYTDRLFSFRITRPASFRFRSGEFVMIGLPDVVRSVYRAYSIASPAWDEEIEFFSIKVPDGALTSKLAHIRVGDTIWMKKKPVGTLVLDALRPGKRLWMISTGTGFAPFASLIRDPETYEKFDQVIVTHTCREVAELQYGFDRVAGVREDPLIGEFAVDKLQHYATTTRQASDRMGRITTLIENGELFADLGVPTLNPETDRVMICGSSEMLADVKALCEDFGLTEGSNSQPGDFVIEKAFVG
jgi:ferredoxin/flavodoxin---NADP+ reductase